jgi:hypothetical protein
MLFRASLSAFTRLRRPPAAPLSSLDGWTPGATGERLPQGSSARLDLFSRRLTVVMSHGWRGKRHGNVDYRSRFPTFVGKYSPLIFLTPGADTAWDAVARRKWSEC